ncbi:MAG: DUF3303 domain-containing protein [Candidatus Hermodarchaeia archaeon]
MLLLVKIKWAIEHTKKVIQIRLDNPMPPPIKTLGEAVIYGKHKVIGLYESPDEITMFKALTPYVGHATFKVIPAVTVEDAIKIYSGK